MSWKVRGLLSLAAATVLLLGWELWRDPGPRTWRPAVGSSFSQRRLEKRCKEFFEQFCRTKPDFGIGTFTDPTGEVWLDSESELAIREARAQSENWIEAVFSRKRLARISEIEQWVKLEMIQWIQSQPETVFSPRDRQELLWRIKDTRLDFPSPKRGYPDEPELLMHSQAYYERLGGGVRGSRRLRFGGAYVLGTSSRFNLVFTLAHELAHAIDPCELRSTGWSVPAFDRLGACFTSEGLAATPKTLVECRRNDQMAETFADWVAVKISARALQKWGSEYPEPQRWASVGNSVRDLCEDDDLEPPPESETHPHPRIRIEKILGTDPQIRDYLGCSASLTRACSLE